MKQIYFNIQPKKTKTMKNSKHDQIKSHLLSGNAITGLQAMNLYDVYRLSSVINRLRVNDNLPIKTKMLLGKDGKSTYAKYYIAQDQ